MNEINECFNLLIWVSWDSELVHWRTGWVITMHDVVSLLICCTGVSCLIKRGGYQLLHETSILDIVNETLTVIVQLVVCKVSTALSRVLSTVLCFEFKKFFLFTLKINKSLLPFFSNKRYLKLNNCVCSFTWNSCCTKRCNDLCM